MTIHRLTPRTLFASSAARRDDIEPPGNSRALTLLGRRTGDTRDAHSDHPPFDNPPSLNDCSSDERSDVSRAVSHADPKWPPITNWLPTGQDEPDRSSSPPVFGPRSRFA